MEASNQSLAMLLALAGLIGATTEYAHIVRRRISTRSRSAVALDALQESGLRGLVRVFVVNDSP